MNSYDSERVLDLLSVEGYSEISHPEDADMVVFMTCHIREKAAEKLYSDLGRLQNLKLQRSREGRRLVVGVLGCTAQAEGEEICRRQPLVDFVIGPQAYHNIPDILRKISHPSQDLGGNRSALKRVVAAEFPLESKFDFLPNRTMQKGSFRSWITVQEGCDKFCTFCVVPYTRGAEFSRPVLDLVREAETLVQQGVLEITLLGQNVNAYSGEDENGKKCSLAQLIRKVSDIEGLERVRYTTSHPRDMSEDLIDEHVYNPKLMPYLHLPVQSGSDKILKAMNRGHTADSYISLIEKIRAVRPDIAISGDFIVGFPGETEKDFEQTLNLVELSNYAQSFSFKYSVRPGTPAADMLGQVSEMEKSERLMRLQALLFDSQLKFNKSCVGRVLSILFDKRGRNSGQIVGRSPYLQSVYVEGQESLLGQIVPVLIEGNRSQSLSGALCYPKAG
jgi:tRNA-2-methylthio-N6-dimethylallyladenosine synthase